MATPSRPVKRAFRHHSNQSSIPLHGPVLSASIQTSLLNVGMRIRKSVPEGYRTKPKPPTTSNSYAPFRIDGSLHRSYSPAGLLPYCGILKTGNLEQGPTPLQDDVPRLDFSNDDDAFPSSQESILSDVSSGDRFASLPLLVNSNKRPYDEKQELSPTHPDPLRSHPFGNANATHVMALRPMLQPKTRKARPASLIVPKDQGGEGMDVDEFEEAGFLMFEDAMRDDGF